MKREGRTLINRLKFLTTRFANRLLNENNASYTEEQSKILHQLWNKEGLLVSELARNTGVAFTTLTLMSEAMERNGLLVREKDTVDRRKRHIYLTEKGRSLQKQDQKISERLHKVFYDGFSKEEIDQFESYLKRIINNFEE